MACVITKCHTDAWVFVHYLWLRDILFLGPWWSGVPALPLVTMVSTRLKLLPGTVCVGPWTYYSQCLQRCPWFLLPLKVVQIDIQGIGNTWGHVVSKGHAANGDIQIRMNQTTTCGHGGIWSHNAVEGHVGDHGPIYHSSQPGTLLIFFFFTHWEPATKIPNKYTETYFCFWVPDFSLACL